MAMSAMEYASSFDELVSGLVSELDNRVPAFAQRLVDVGLSPDDIRDVSSLDRLPVMSKDELLTVQSAEPPYGGLIASDFKPQRVFQSPGPLYEPQRSGPDPWRWVPALRAAGFTSDDVVLNAFGYHLTPAGAMFEQAIVELGATVLPGGIGSFDLQARACQDLGVTAYVGLPSYLKELWQRSETDGLPPSGWPLRKAFLAAEPLTPAIRTWIEERIPVVRQGYGTAETGNLGFECERTDGWHVPHDALVQVSELASGKALWEGQEGQVVVTLLGTEVPLVRFGTGDLSAFVPEACTCGLATPRLAGWLGRVGEAVKVRGMFLHPRQISEVMTGVAGIEHFRFFVDRSEHRDVLTCEVVPAAGADTTVLPARVINRVKSGLRFDVEVSMVERLNGDDGSLIDRRE
jgi:phenylacetate-CoA ligase